MFGFQLHQEKAELKIFMVTELLPNHAGAPALGSAVILHPAAGWEPRQNGVPAVQGVSSYAFLGSAQNLDAM